MTDLNIPAGSQEYINAPVTANQTLAAQAVAISIDNKQTWLPAGWIGDAGTRRTARTTSPVTWVKGTYTVYVRVTDSPEVPIVKAGRVIVT